MNIGQKIKQLRLSKLMTQSELAGDQITRNMLSSIEHGTALPSLPTAMYIAERLSVPVGYLLSQGEDEFIYRKMANIANIHRALKAGDHTGCLSLLSAFGGESDDELSLIRAQCEYNVGLNALHNGRLRLAAAAWDRALNAAAATLFDTAWLRARIAVYFRYLSGLSFTLVSDVLDAEEIEQARASGEVIVEYVSACEALERENNEAAKAFMESHPASPYGERLCALLLMREEKYPEAQEVLERLLVRDELTFGVLLYEVFGDLETCYRKNDDYKRAYEFSGSRIGLLERLLEEV